jgi:heme-degrading monooxygenase HmoA
MRALYCCIWEFQVPPEREAAFRRAYGPDGAWVALFRRAPGYLDTQLLADIAAPGRYLTIDRWESAAAYRAFRHDFAEAYAAMDSACAELTRREALIGEFAAVG